MMNKPNSSRPTKANSSRPKTVLEKTPGTIFGTTRFGSSTSMSTQPKNNPNATSSIKDYSKNEIKTSDVPNSIFNWYNKNIINSNNSPAVVLQQKKITAKVPAIKRDQVSSSFDRSQMDPQVEGKAIKSKADKPLSETEAMAI